MSETTEAWLAAAVRPGETVLLWMPSKHMGNLLVSLRAINALVQSTGDHRCVLIIDESYRELMEAAPTPPVIYFPRQRIAGASLAGKLRLIAAFVREVRRHRPSVSIAIEGDTVSQKFVPLAGSRVSAGPDNRYCKYFSLKVPLDHGQQHVFHDYAAVARHLGGHGPAPGYVRLRATEPWRQRVAALLADAPYPGNAHVILHPCATKDYKQWPVAAFARVADALSERHINVLLSGAGQRDGETISLLERAARRPLLSLHGKLSLGELVALAETARVFLGNDTGPTHLAAACGTPTVALFGPTDEHRWGPLGDNTAILRSDVPCEPDCQRRRCRVNYRCMRTLSATAVLDRIQPLLKPDSNGGKTSGW